MPEIVIMAAATPAAIALGLDAGAVVRDVIALMRARHGGRGGGGGRPDYAEGKWITDAQRTNRR